ncbi:unnamed protein product [Lupinus luteus]|uniref:Uncharacterized protein n=1 Tax=Lupinus luteus TaxID=3873 RepID=A0AAV1X1F6_LUPLU
MLEFLSCLLHIFGIKCELLLPDSSKLISCLNESLVNLRIPLQPWFCISEQNQVYTFILHILLIHFLLLVELLVMKLTHKYISFDPFSYAFLTLCCALYVHKQQPSLGLGVHWADWCLADPAS